MGGSVVGVLIFWILTMIIGKQACMTMTRPFASTWLREITFRMRLPYSCPPWPGEGAGGQRGAFGVIWLLYPNAVERPVDNPRLAMDS